MATLARLRKGETLGDRVIKVDHAGEHGAVCIYTAQRCFARWRAPDLVEELSHFRDHERGHRALFGSVLAARGLRRCRSIPQQRFNTFRCFAVLEPVGRSRLGSYQGHAPVGP